MTEPADTAARRRPPIDLRATGLAWALAVVITAVLIAATHYESPDPDSSLHAGIAARVSELPLRQWIAPEWWGLWNSEGPYCEHPAGIFILPAALARLGFPSISGRVRGECALPGRDVHPRRPDRRIRGLPARRTRARLDPAVHPRRLRVPHPRQPRIRAAGRAPLRRLLDRTCPHAPDLDGRHDRRLLRGPAREGGLCDRRADHVRPVAAGARGRRRRPAGALEGLGGRRGHAASPVRSWRGATRPPTSARPADPSWRSTRAGSFRQPPSPKGRSSAARPTRRPGTRHGFSGTRCRSACSRDSWPGAA